MSQELARLFIALLATGLVGRQALGAIPGSRRRQAFTLGALGFALMAVANGLPLVGLATPVALTLSIGSGLALLLGCMVNLYLAYREGKLNGQFRRAGTPVGTEREKTVASNRRKDVKK